MRLAAITFEKNLHIFCYKIKIKKISRIRIRESVAVDIERRFILFDINIIRKRID